MAAGYLKTSIFFSIFYMKTVEPISIYNYYFSFSVEPWEGSTRRTKRSSTFFFRRHRWRFLGIFWYSSPFFTRNGWTDFAFLPCFYIAVSKSFRRVFFLTNMTDFTKTFIFSGFSLENDWTDDFVLKTLFHPCLFTKQYLERSNCHPPSLRGKKNEFC